MHFTRAQHEALTQLAELWADRSFVLIGASALQVHLPLNRNTRDLDITLACDLDEFPAGLDHLHGWAQTPERAHAWLGPGNARVDVLPAGPEVTAAGYVQWPDGVRMSVVGFRHVFAHTIRVELGAGRAVKVAQMHVLAFLKMVAYLDRRTEREHDLGDIAHVLEGYVGDDDKRRWSDEIIAAGLDFEDVSSYLLGRDLGQILDANECSESLRFLDTVTADQTIGSLARRAPPAWRGSDEIALQRLAAFRRGLMVA